MDFLINHHWVKQFDQPALLFDAAACHFAIRAKTAIVEKGIFRVVLSGGETAVYFFEALQKQVLAWDKIQFFFGDERYLPLDDAGTNYQSAYQHLFSKLPIPCENIFPIPTELQPNAAASRYSETLKEIFQLKKGQAPPFDLIYLGLGADAHTASLMPYSDPVKHFVKDPKSTELVLPLWVPALNNYRITLTPFALNHATSLVFLVFGIQKAQALLATLSDPFNPEQNPAQLIQYEPGKIRWYIDKAAGSYLTQDLCHE